MITQCVEFLDDTHPRIANPNFIRAATYAEATTSSRRPSTTTSQLSTINLKILPRLSFTAKVQTDEVQDVLDGLSACFSLSLSGD